LESVRLPSRQRGRWRNRPNFLVGDKGYSTPAVRRYLAGRRIGVVIPTRSDQKPLPAFDRDRYRARSAVEQGVGWLKEHRRVGTRHEKLSLHFLAMAKLAMIQRSFHHLEGC
jgi:transposase